MSIDYSRMQAVWPQQKRDLAKAMKLPVEQRRPAVEAECVKAIAEWNEIGAWPDDWSHFQRALDDVRPWSGQISLDDLYSAHLQAVAALAAAERAEAERAHAEKYPEHKKLEALNGDNDTVARFLEWLSENDYAITSVEEEEPQPLLYRSVTSWLSEYFEINPAKIAAEKDAMIEEIRQAQKERDAAKAERAAAGTEPRTWSHSRKGEIRGHLRRLDDVWAFIELAADFGRHGDEGETVTLRASFLTPQPTAEDVTP